MEDKMRRVSRGMSIRMGVVMSFFLSITGHLLSGHFSWRGFAVSFVVSTILSILIGIVVPIEKISEAFFRDRDIPRNSIQARIMQALVADVIYTPIMTVVMVFIAYSNIMRRSGGNAPVGFVQMLLPSLIVCFLVGFVLAFIFQPLFMKILFEKYGINPEEKRP